MTISHSPVITIDGPTASGKGTVAHKVADRLKFHYLDSGALYRAVGFVVCGPFGAYPAHPASLFMEKPL